MAVPGSEMDKQPSLPERPEPYSSQLWGVRLPVHVNQSRLSLGFGLASPRAWTAVSSSWARVQA